MFVTRCRSWSFQKITRYYLQNLSVTKNSLLVAQIIFYLLQEILVPKNHSLLVETISSCKYICLKSTKSSESFSFFTKICFLKPKNRKLFQVNTLRWNLLLASTTICKWVKTQQLLPLSQKSELHLNKSPNYLYQVTNTKLKFSQVILLKFKIC